MNKPVVLSMLHSEHPSRWVTITGRGLASVTGFESEVYLADSANREIWAVASFVDRFSSCRISCVRAMSAKRRDSTTALAPTRSRPTEPLWLRRGADDARHEREHGERRELELSVYAPLFDLPKRAGAVRRAARKSGRIAQRALLGGGAFPLEPGEARDVLLELGRDLGRHGRARLADRSLEVGLAGTSLEGLAARRDRPLKGILRGAA